MWEKFPNKGGGGPLFPLLFKKITKNYDYFLKTDNIETFKEKSPFGNVNINSRNHTVLQNTILEISNLTHIETAP